MADAGELELTSRVPAHAAGKTLAEYLSSRFRYHTPEQWLGEISAGRISIDARPGTANQRLKAGAVLLYRKPHSEPPINRDVRILHRDDAILVADKPPHLPMHTDGPFVRHTLIHLLRSELGHPEAHVVHRLDRETSGILVVARSSAARRTLEGQFASGRVRKSYLAVVEGLVVGNCECDAPIGHSTTSSIALRRSAAAEASNSKSAHTAFEVLEHGPERTLLRCLPSTGRTHQIRVHLEHLGHPVVGDKLYGRPDADYLAFVKRMKAGGDQREAPAGRPARHLLHAAALTFDHPTTGEATRFESQPPAEFRRWLLAEG